MSKDLRESRVLPILNYTNHKKEGADGKDYGRKGDDFK